jgi:hypothetical protein
MWLKSRFSAIVRIIDPLRALVFCDSPAGDISQTRSFPRLCGHST